MYTGWQPFVPVNIVILLFQKREKKEESPWIRQKYEGKEGGGLWFAGYFVSANPTQDGLGIVSAGYFVLRDL